MTDGVNPTGVNKISVHSMNTFWTYLISSQSTSDYFQKCFFLLYSNLIYINLHMGWLAHNQSASTSGNFPQYFPQDFHTEFPTAFPTRFSHKIFPQDFPARISHKIFPQDFPELDPDWLVNHHPIPNAKFPPITALLNRPTYHKSAKVSPPPFPQILWNPKSINKLTLNETVNIL